MKFETDMEQLAYEYMEESSDKLDENKLEQAALLAQNALHLFKKANNLKMYTRVLNLMGVIYATIGNEMVAIDYYLEGLECAINNGFYSYVPLFYNNIGSRYQELHEHEKAISYFERAELGLKNPESRKEDRYANWCMITYLNLSASYTVLKEFEKANKYLELAKKYADREETDAYRLAFLSTQLRLYWEYGKREYVKEHVDELVQEAVFNSNKSDYVENIAEVCKLLKRMKEYEKWKSVITAFEAFATVQGSVYYQLLMTEMWMEYYNKIDENQKYVEMCVKHADLYKKQREIADKERAAAIDIKIELQEKEAACKRAELQMTRDTLTGLGNRYMLENDVKKVLENEAKIKDSIAVGILDIDCFKQKNDTYGHVEGDDCLCQVANVLEKVIAEQGRAYRFGGDEFVVIIEDGRKEVVTRIAEDIKKGIHELQIENVNSIVSSEVTVSQGYACLKPMNMTNRNELLQHADDALYKVKNNGRNGYFILQNDMTLV